MAWIGAVAGAAASAIGSGEQAGANADAIAQSKALADRMYYTGMPAYGKEGKQGMWSLLRPELSSYLAGDRAQIISPDLQNAQYAGMVRPIQESYQQGRGQLEQGMANRGMDYGNLMPKALGQYDQRYQQTIGDLGTNIATKAAQLNYGAQQDQLNRLLQSYTGLFQKGDSVKNAWMQQGTQAQQGAINATAANAGNYWSSLAGALGGAAGSLPWQQWSQGWGQPTGVSTMYPQAIGPTQGGGFYPNS